MIPLRAKIAFANVDMMKDKSVPFLVLGRVNSLC